MKEKKFEGCFMWSNLEMWGVDGAVIEVADNDVKEIDILNPKYPECLKELNNGAKIYAKKSRKTKYKEFSPSVIYSIEGGGKLFVTSDSPFKEKGFHGGSRKGAGRHQKHKTVEYTDSTLIKVPSCIKGNMERFVAWILSADRDSLCKTIDEVIEILQESEKTVEDEILINLRDIKEHLLLT